MCILYLGSDQKVNLHLFMDLFLELVAELANLKPDLLNRLSLGLDVNPRP